MGADDVGDVALPVGAADLAQVPRERAQHRRLAPRQAGAQHQRVEAVGADVPAPHRVERLREALGEVVLGARRHGVGVAEAQAEVVDPAAHAVAAGDAVGPLVDDDDAQRLQRRQHRRERRAPAREVELETAVAGVGVRGAVEAHGGVVAVPLGALRGEAVEDPQVEEPALGAEVLLVGLRERLADAREDRALLAGRVLAQPVRPRARGLGELVRQRLEVGRHRLLAPGVHRDVQERELVLGDPGGVLEVGAAELAHEHVLHPRARHRRVPVARQVDHAREVAAVRVAAQEQPDPPPFGEVEHTGGRRLERVAVGAQQLGARVGLQHLEQALARPRVDREPGLGHDLLHAPRHHGDAEHVGVPGGDGEDPEEAVLADEAAFLVVDAHAHVERVLRAVHGRPGAGPGEHEQLARRGVGGDAGGAHAVRAGGQRARDEAVAAQHAQPGGEDAPQGRPLGGVDQLLAPVAEQDQVALREPAQEGDGVGRVRAAAGRRPARRPGRARWTPCGRRPRRPRARR